jgi:3D (Asp-Asp-Asp) domain-containing protein
MTKSLLGGGAVITALLSATLLLQPQTSVAETLASASLDQPQQPLWSGGVAVAKASLASTLTDGATKPSETGNPVTAPKPEAAESAEAVSTVKSGPAASEAASPTLLTQSFIATAYSLRGRTASGLVVAKGIIAADRRVLPLGSRVRIEAGSYTGEYLVADTGGAIRGRRIDVWMPSGREAMRFGRRPVKVTVLSYGGRRARPHARGRN